MATFNPPVTDGILAADPSRADRDGAHALWRYYGAWAMGKTVWKDQLGEWHEAIYPYQGGETHEVWTQGVKVVDIADTSVESLANAEVVYQGGHVHIIGEAGDADFDDLVAGGYRDFIVPANALLGSDGTFEDGSASTWVGSGSSVAASNAQANRGAWSLLVTKTGSAGSLFAVSHNSGSQLMTPVTVGSVVSVSVRMRPETVAGSKNCRAVIDFFTNPTTFNSRVNGTLTSAVDDTWHNRTVTATTPAGATLMRVLVEMQSADVADTYYLDDVFVARGPVPYDPSTGWVD
jgi:hypothetical protein